MVCLLRYPGESVTQKIFNIFQIDLAGLRTRLEQMLETPDAQADTPTDKIPMSVQAQGRLHLAFLFSKQYKSEAVESYHLMLAILKPAQLDSQNTIKMLLGQAGLTFETFEDELRRELHLSEPAAAGQYNDDDDDDDNDRRTVRKGKDAKSATPMLDSFGKDLTKMAAEGKIDPVVGRQKELERIAQILCRRKKNNPVLIGEPGVGKSALAEGLALQISSGHVSRTLLHKRIVSLDMAGLVAGTNYRGQLEERVKTILEELEKNTDVILFIDEL
ncbi:MAG: ATP-dependent Clp protease ATP-binding subunit, partial [Bacteroidales bacterium]|nr:ATP-dependent Clp protease ATP-binding subunit [Bacteroidales bacterium]